MSRDALIVGINNYANLQPLVAPAKDAEAVYRLLDQYGEFSNLTPLPLIDSNSDDKNSNGFSVGKKGSVNFDQLGNALGELFNPKSKQYPEMALFYFSGHGQRRIIGGVSRGYLAVSDSQASGDSMGFPLEMLYTILVNSPVRKQVIWLDCCYSGELFNFQEFHSFSSSISGGYDRCFIVASRDYQLAFQQGSGEHSILTAALLKALDPKTLGIMDSKSIVIRIEEQFKQSGIQTPICINSGAESIILTRMKVEITQPSTHQNICMISSEYPPHVLGGLGVHVNQLTKELAAFVDIDLVLPHQKVDYAEPPTPSRIRTRPLTTVEANYDDPFSWLFFSQQAFSLIENIYPKSAKPAVIHCHDWVTVLCGIKCRWAMNVPLIFHVHLPNRTPFCSSVENLGLACADLVTVNSQAMCEQLHKRFPDKKIKVMPNGVDITIFKKLDIPNSHAEGQYVLFVGRLVEQKGVDYLLRAFVHVRERFPGVKLKIVGNGPCNLAYVRLADCLLIKDAVEFLGWTDSSSELSRLYQGASVVVVPSIYEPFGMTALEAMACARPVVASKTGGLQEFIKHGVTGYLAEPKDYLDLAQWIIRLLDNKKLRQELGDRAGQTVTEDNSVYRWTSIAQQFHLIYEELVRQELNLNVPEQGNDYVQQIRSLSTGNDQTILNNLFIRGRQ